MNNKNVDAHPFMAKSSSSEQRTANERLTNVSNAYHHSMYSLQLHLGGCNTNSAAQEIAIYSSRMHLRSYQQSRIFILSTRLIGVSETIKGKPGNASCQVQKFEHGKCISRISISIRIPSQKSFLQDHCVWHTDRKLFPIDSGACQ